MKILITNDDGIDAPGMAVLEAQLSEIADVTVFGPKGPWSGCGHQVTTGSEIPVSQLADNRYCVEGTPADCVRVALRGYELDFDWVVAGVNDGGNMGVDTFMSGTVAAVREAAWLGKNGIAISQYRKPGSPRTWSFATQQVIRIVKFLQSQKASDGIGYWNVNLPDVENEPFLLPTFTDIEIVQTPIEREPLPTRMQATSKGFLFAGDYHQRPKTSATDVDVCFAGKIAASWVSRCGQHD